MSSNNRLAKCFGDIGAAIDLIQLWTERKGGAEILNDCWFAAPWNASFW